MQITKRRGSIVLFDTDKIASSILKANAGIPLESISEKKAALLASEVFERVSAENEIITTNDVRRTTAAILRENDYVLTADRYIAYAENKADK